MNKEQELVVGELRRHFPTQSDESLLRQIEGWELIPNFADGELTSVSMMHGTEYHLVSTPNYKLNRKLAHDALALLMERYGFLTTRVQHEDKANQRFNKVFGFKPTWSDDTFQYFILTDVPFGEKSCP